jgi:hypothetical protein
MSANIVIIATGLLLIVRLGRSAALADGSQQSEMMQSGRHPLVLLIGSLLSLIALFSLVRHLPPEVGRSWPVVMHVAFICLWLMLMARQTPASAEAE